MLVALTLLLSTPATAEEPASTEAIDPPVAGVQLRLNAYGEQLAGHLVVDADALTPLGMSLQKGDPPQTRTGERVPLVHGMRVTGTRKGVRIVDDAVDAMMYFDGNDDGYLDASDPAFAALYLFVDADGDGKLTPAEAKPLGDIGVESVSRFGDIRMKDKWTKTGDAPATPDE